MAKDDPLSRTSKDITDPFRYEGNFAPERSNGIRIPWERISPVDMVLLRQLGKRVTAILVDMRERGGVQLMPPHDAMSSADFAVAHLQRPLDLQAMMLAPDDELLREYVTIARYINRRMGVLLPGARLRFLKT